MIKRVLKRVLSLVLVLVLTMGLWNQLNLAARRQDFAFKVYENQNGIDYGVYDEKILSEFYKKENEIQDLIKAAGLSEDKEFSGRVLNQFKEFYYFAKDLVSNNGEIQDVDAFEARAVDIFNGFFALDTKLNEINPKLMGKLTNKGFVTAAISIVWDMVTYYDNQRVEKQEMMPGITRIEDVPYIDDGTNEHMLDIFYPENNTKKLPVIIDIHGGGLMMGDKDSNRVYSSVLADRGYIVFCVNYRLSPDVLYPAMVQDLMKSFKWINEHAEEYNGDLSKVYVTGDSAGGQLAYYVPLVNTSEKLQELYEVEPSGLEIDALGLVSGMYDMKNGFNAPLISCFFGFDYKNSPYYNYIQPEDALPLGELPPCYVVTAARDFLHASGVYFDEVLTEQGIEHQFRDWGLNASKGSGHITSVAYPDIEESQKTINEMLAFFEAHTK